MSVIFLLITFSLILAVVFLAAFIWSVKDGQYEDDYTPSVRILFDDAAPVGKSAAEQSDSTNHNPSNPIL